MTPSPSPAINFDNNRLSIIDQTRLPHEEIWIPINFYEDMDEAIKKLKVRGAPLIGVAAGLTLAMMAVENKTPEEILKAAQVLRQSRPTAVNLMIVIDRLTPLLKPGFYSREQFIEEAKKIFIEDQELCLKMGEFGQEVIQENDQVLTHCNAGALATGGIGTAVGVILTAHQKKKNIHVYVDETRPLLQGARLTTWELAKADVPHTLICDNMAGCLMKEGKIHKIIVGADRIARNGDSANKIGTYSLSVLAQFHQIPFYIAAPYTTFDPECAHGKLIPIEERSASEVQREWTKETTPVFNPAFDVTPAELITAWITDKGVFHSPDDLQKFLG